MRRQPGNNRHDPTWQELTRTHRSSSAAPSDQDELGGSRILRPRQRVTLTTVLDLPSGKAALTVHFVKLGMVTAVRLHAHDAQKYDDASRIVAPVVP